MAHRKAHSIIASVFLFLSLGLLALHSSAVQARANLSGLWWDPAESGWGLTLDHQAQFLFATFFIYGENGTPTWLVAQLDAATADQTSFSGPVYTTTGTTFSRPFVASDTRATQVGAASFAVQSDIRLSITYSVNGVSVSKVVVRQASKPLVLAGTYDGLATTGPFDTDLTDFTITQSDTTLVIRRAAFFAGMCEFSGLPSQFGYRIAVAGTYRCSDFSEGTWQTNDLTIQDGATLVGTVTKTRTAGTATFHGSFERWVALKIN